MRDNSNWGHTTTGRSRHRGPVCYLTEGKFFPLPDWCGPDRAAATDALYEPTEDGEDRLLDEIERRGCLYFFEMADPHRAGAGSYRGQAPYRPGVASIAATGFGLSALCIADTRGYLDRAAVKARVRTTLQHLNTESRARTRLLFHFLDSSTGSGSGKARPPPSIAHGCCAARCIAGSTGTIPRSGALAVRSARPHRLALDARWRPDPVPRMEAGTRFSLLSLGPLCRGAGHVPARRGSRRKCHSAQMLGCLETAHARLQGRILHRCRHAAVRPSVLPRLVRFPEPRRTATPTISGTRSGPRRRTACIAWAWRTNSPGTVPICGA